MTKAIENKSVDTNGKCVKKPRAFQRFLHPSPFPATRKGAAGIPQSAGCAIIPDYGEAERCERLTQIVPGHGEQGNDGCTGEGRGDVRRDRRRYDAGNRECLAVFIGIEK